MPSTIIQNYFNDTTIPKATRQQVLSDLNSGKVNEAGLESAISTKHGTKFSTASTPNQGQIWSPVNVGGMNINPFSALRSATEPVRQTLDQIKVPKPIEDFANFEMGGQAGKFITNMGAHAAGAAGEGIGNIASAGGQLASKLTGQEAFANVGKAIQGGVMNLANTARKSAQQTSGENESSLSGTAGDFLGTTGRIIGTAALTPQATVGAGWGGLGTTLMNSPISTFAQTATNTGNLASPTDYATGAALDSAFYGAGQGLKKLGQSAYSKLVPSTKGQRDLDKAMGVNMGKYMQENADVPALANRQDAAAAIRKSLTPLNKEFTGLVEGAGQAGVANNFDDITGNITKKVLANPKIKIAPDEVKGLTENIDDIVSFYKNANQGQLSIVDQDALKQELYGSLESYFSKLAPKSENVKSVARAEIAKALKESINSGITEGLGAEAGKRALNINTIRSNLIPAVQRLTKQGGGYSNFLTDAMTGGQAFGSGLAHADFGKALGGAATAVGLKRLLFSPRTMSLVGAASKFSPKIAPVVNPLIKGNLLRQFNLNKIGR